MSSAKLQDLIHEGDLVSLQQAMTSGECTSEDLVLAYIERIHRYNPLINAVLEINPDVLEIARNLDL
ncbi:amidase [compost metagenome]